MSVNLGDLFAGAVQSTPEAVAVMQGEVALTYRELDRRADRVAQACLRLRVEPGDRVAVLLGNDYRYVETVFGALRIGAVVVPLSPRASPETLHFILDDAEVVLGFLGDECRDRMVPMLAALPRVRAIVATGAATPGVLEYDHVMAQADGTPPIRRQAVDGVCLQPYTSGSTGRPKGVLLTHAGQWWNADVLRQAEAISPDDRALIAIPLFHKNAMITAKSFLLAGASMVIHHGFDPAAAIDALDRHRVTYIAGVPAMYHRLVALQRQRRDPDAGTLRMASTGSAAASPELLEEFERVFGAPMIEGYGLTEGGPIPIANRFGRSLKPGSVGQVVPGAAVRLVGDDGLPVADGVVGELWVNNPGVMRGYWKRPDVTAEKLAGGWLRTGDLMRRDADGDFFFVGRKDDRINVGGEQVYPKEVEDIISWHPAVAAVAVVPAPHPEKGEVPVAFVVKRENEGVTEETLKAFFLARGPAYAHPRRICFLATLPLAASGKPDRQALLALARQPAEGREP